MVYRSAVSTSVNPPSRRSLIVNGKCVVPCLYLDQMSLYAPIGCGFQTGAGTVLNVLKPGPEDSIVVFGLGSVGLTALMAAKYLRVGRHSSLEFIASSFEI